MTIIANKINATPTIVASSNEVEVASSSVTVVGPSVNDALAQVLLPSVCTVTEHEESSLYGWLSINTNGSVRTQSCISLRISSGVFPPVFKN